jgi:hypothetical protein
MLQQSIKQRCIKSNNMTVQQLPSTQQQSIMHAMTTNHSAIKKKDQKCKIVAKINN